MQGLRALLLLTSLAATSLMPHPGLLQEPDPPQRFPSPYVESCAVVAHRLVVYRGPRNGMSPGQRQEFVIEQGGGLSFHTRKEKQTVATVTQVPTTPFDPLGLVLEHFGSVEEGKEMARPTMNLRDVGPGNGLGQEEVMRVLLMTDGQMVLQLEVALVAPYSASHARTMAAMVGLWDQLLGPVLEANTRRGCKVEPLSLPQPLLQPPSLEKTMEEWEIRWRAEARKELEGKLKVEMQ